jgi:hypothetical protein
MSAKVSGVTNWVAPAVITTCTERSCFVNLLAISAALYAEIEAVTPRMMFMRAVFIPHSGSRIFSNSALHWTTIWEISASFALALSVFNSRPSSWLMNSSA